MSYENVKLWFAKDANEHIVTIDEINDENKNNTYLCPVCGSNLKPKAVKSKQITSHFAHVDASKCNSESQIHFWFKHKFLEKGDKFTIAADKVREYTVKDILVEQPYKVENGIYKPDVTILTECSNTIYFEIAFTNKKQVKDYLDLWLELKNIVVEVDIKQLILKDTIPVFKALFYDGKCFNTKRNDTYYNTIGKYKEMRLKGNINNKIKEQIYKLDWFWNDVLKYKEEKINISELSTLIDSINDDEKAIIFKILNKQSCSPIFEDYINYKSDLTLKEIIKTFEGHWILNKYEFTVSLPFKSWKTKMLTSELRLKNLNNINYISYDILQYPIQKIIDEINKIIKNIVKYEKLKTDLEFAKNNIHLHNAIEKINNHYKKIDENYKFYNRFTYSQNVTFYYNSNQIMDFSLPEKIIYSKDEHLIECYFKEEIEKYMTTLERLQNRELIIRCLNNLKTYCDKIKYYEEYQSQERDKYKKWRIINKKRTVSFSLKFYLFSEEIIEVVIDKISDMSPSNLGWIKSKIYIYKNKLYFGRAVIERNNILDQKEIKVIDNIECDLKNIIIELILKEMDNKCQDCKKSFELDKGELDFFISRDMDLPKRCKCCRRKRKQNKLTT